MEFSTVTSKKYIKRYKEYKNYTPPPPTPLIGCIYQAKTVDKLNVMGMLMEYGEVESTIKNKHGTQYKVLSNTLKTVLAV